MIENQKSVNKENYKVSLTLRCFELTDGADVGVMVTDGVIVKLEPVLDWPYDDRCEGGPPGVNVAPPGNDDRVCGITLTPERDVPIGCRTNGDVFRFDFVWAVICKLEGDGGGAGVTLNEPFDDNDNAAGISTNGFELFDAFECVTIRFSFITCWDCFIFFNKTNFVSSLRNSSRSFRNPRSRSQISAADNS